MVTEIIRNYEQIMNGDNSIRVYNIEIHNIILKYIPETNTNELSTYIFAQLDLILKKKDIIFPMMSRWENEYKVQHLLFLIYYTIYFGGEITFNFKYMINRIVDKKGVVLKDNIMEYIILLENKVKKQPLLMLCVYHIRNNRKKYEKYIETMVRDVKKYFYVNSKIKLY